MAGRRKTRRSRWSWHYRYGRRNSAASTQAGEAVAHNGRSDNTPETVTYHRASAGAGRESSPTESRGVRTRMRGWELRGLVQNKEARKPQ